MAIGLIMQFESPENDPEPIYDRVMDELGLVHGNDPNNWPDGIISHAAGASDEGDWVVVDVWDSRAHFDEFFSGRLGPALEKVGGMPRPSIAEFDVHNTFGHFKPTGQIDLTQGGTQTTGASGEEELAPTVPGMRATAAPQPTTS